MDKKQLQDEIEKVSDSFIKDQFMESGGVRPMLIAVVTNKAGKSGVAIAPMPDEFTETFEQRHKFMFIVGRGMLQQQDVSHVDAVMFVSEAWSSKLSKADNEKAKKTGYYPKPSDDPNRIEIAMIVGMSDTYETHSIAFKIKGKDNVKTRKLIPYADIGGSEAKMALVDAPLLMAFWKGLGVAK